MKKINHLLLALFCAVFAISVISCGDDNDDNNGSNGGNTKPSAKTEKTVNGHKFINLGLPSGIYWAETNVGASSAEATGSFFAWGETQTKELYYDENSTWYGKAHEGNLTASEDAATATWGEGISTPTEEQFQELIANCDWEWTTKNGVKGYLITGKNEQSIFLPVTGYMKNDELYRDGFDGQYWTSTPSADNRWARMLFMCQTENDHTIVAESRYQGCAIRAIAK